MINDLVHVIDAFNAVLHSSSSRMKNVFLHSLSQAEERFMFSLIIKRDEEETEFQQCGEEV